MARVLRRLKIGEVSVVDKGAGHHCEIVLRKRDGADADDKLKAMLKLGGGNLRQKEGKQMSGPKKLTCPGCGESFSEDSFSEVGKAISHISKASQAVFSDIIKSLQSDGLSKADAVKAVGGHGHLDRDAAARLSELHRQEQAHRFNLAREI